MMSAQHSCAVPSCGSREKINKAKKGQEGEEGLGCWIRLTLVDFSSKVYFIYFSFGPGPARPRGRRQEEERKGKSKGKEGLASRVGLTALVDFFF
jgi:hypothetical protein